MSHKRFVSSGMGFGGKDTGQAQRSQNLGTIWDDIADAASDVGDFIKENVVPFIVNAGTAGMVSMDSHGNISPGVMIDQLKMGARAIQSGGQSIPGDVAAFVGKVKKLISSGAKLPADVQAAYDKATSGGNGGPSASAPPPPMRSEADEVAAQIQARIDEENERLAAEAQRFIDKENNRLAIIKMRKRGLISKPSDRIEMGFKPPDGLNFEQWHAREAAAWETEKQADKQKLIVKDAARTAFNVRHVNQLKALGFHRILFA